MIRLLLSSMKLVIIVVSTVVVALGGFRAFDHYQSQAEEEAGIGEAVVITVGKNDEPEDVAKKLRKAGLIRSEQVFELTVRYVDQDLEPNTYELKKGMSVATIVDLITSEKSEAVTEVEELKITVVEGWRTEQIAEELDKLGYPPGGNAFLRAVEDYPHDSYDFLEGTKKGSLEGFLFPATYDFTSDTTPEELVTMMLNAFDQAVNNAMRDRAEAMNLSLYDVIKIAALVERETAVADERQIVADVYLDRYDQDWTLDADPTVQYVIGEPGDWWPVPGASDLEVDSPYNLYKNRGLGPAPIANPGLNSIMAVLEPADSPFMFFTARLDGSGRHLFATTNEEQNVNQALVESGDDLSEYDSAYLEYLPTNPESFEDD
ncbi:MAG: endolytic transglycosylase MltG [Chloroflexota bacterium]|nr:endolytic transglycosylase MltG [Chloroflexota bacterium]